MTATEFKEILKSLKNQLKGLTIQLKDGRNCTPFTSLKAFGEAVLKAEAKGLGFGINQVWTTTGIKEIRNVGELAGMLSTGTVKAVSFSTRYQAKDFSDYLRNSFGTSV